VRLATLRIDGSTTAARQDGDEYVAIDGVADVGSLLARADWREYARAADGRVIPAAQADLAPVVPNPSKVLCAGLNYRSHILEMGRELPEHPTLFAKFAETLTGPFDDIALPPEDEAVDWEAELAVVIGLEARRVSAAEAPDHIGGYTVCNDISMRTWQYRTSEWLQGKNWEASAPLGPVLVTPDELDPNAAITTSVDGEVRQSGSINDLVHSPADLVAYISTFTTLRPGDVIITGTTGGVGHARTPKLYLRAGQELVTSIAGIGELRNRLVREN
jgi:acylpyruvate hydrolase